MIRRIAAALTLLLACSDHDGSAASSSGIESSKVLSSLSAPELDTVCRWFAQEEYEGLTADSECLPPAVYRSSTKASCEAEADACRANHPEWREGRLASMLANCEEYVVEEECTATVAQLETCVRDHARLARALASSLSCNTPMSGGSATDEQTEPASCDTMSRGCFP